MLPKKSKCFPAILLSFCLMIFPVYLDFSILDTLDDPSDDSDVTPSSPVPGENYEDDSNLRSGKGEGILKSTFYINEILIGQPILGLIPNLLDHSSVLNSKSFILRC